MRRLGTLAPSLALCMGLLATMAPGRSAGAATLAFTGTLGIRLGGMRDAAGKPVYLTVVGSGNASVNASGGGIHLQSLVLASGAFGPSTVTIPGSSVTGTGIETVRFTLSRNLSGSFSGISGGPPGGGPMGLVGVAKLCLFAPGCTGYVPFPLTATVGGAGFGIGGTRTATGGVNVTLRDAPWTVGQPTMTIHTAGSTITTTLVVLPGGFVHGPASLTSSTAQPSGVVQLVSVSKVYTSLWSAFPELPLIGVMTLRFVPEPGTALLLGTGVAVLAVFGRRRARQ